VFSTLKLKIAFNIIPNLNLNQSIKILKEPHEHTSTRDTRSLSSIIAQLFEMEMDGLTQTLLLLLLSG